MTRGWAPTHSGLGPGSGRGSRRPRKAARGGATQLDRLPAPGPGRRPPGAQDEDSPHQTCGESPAWPCLTGSRVSLCHPQTTAPGGWTSPHGSSEGLVLPDRGGEGIQPQARGRWSQAGRAGCPWPSQPGWSPRRTLIPAAHRSPGGASRRGADISRGEGPGSSCAPRAPRPEFQGRPRPQQQGLGGRSQGAGCGGSSQPARLPVPGKGREPEARTPGRLPRAGGPRRPRTPVDSTTRCP